MALTLDRIEALAPDQGSLAAARKLLKPAAWPVLAAGDGLIWGDCQGSGATPYRVAVHESDAGYKCTCPSRKFPCKHVLALMWMRAGQTAAFAPGAVPEWVKDWLSRRRGTTAAAASSEENQHAKSVRIAESETEAEEPVDPKAEQRSAAARERNRLERETAILAGLEDLDTWLLDQVQHGMANFVTRADQACRTIARRLIDAKASGLAGRLDALPTRLFTLPAAERVPAAIKELGQIHLIGQAYRRAVHLPPSLAADARQTVGWSLTRESLLNDPEAVRVEGKWRVFALLAEVQPDRLRRVETWLWRTDPNDMGGARSAVLIDFVPVSTGAAASGYLVGDSIDAELRFYPSPVPLRAQVATLRGSVQQSSETLKLPDQSLGDSYANYERSLAQLPWLTVAPLHFRAAAVRRHGDRLYLCDCECGLTLPLHTSLANQALPLASLDRIDGIGLWNGYEFTLGWAETKLGRWTHS